MQQPALKPVQQPCGKFDLMRQLLSLGLLITVLSVTVVCCWPNHTLSGLTRWLNVGEAPHRVNAVFILPGGPQTRPFVAATLVRLGLADSVLVPKNVKSPLVQAGIVPETHEMLIRTLEANGLDRSQIVLLEARTSHTFGDAVALKNFLDRSPDTTVAVVTSHYHARRTRWSLRRRLGPAVDRIHLVAAPVDEFNEDNWWVTKEGLHAYVSEYLKFAFYLLRYDARSWGVGLAAMGCAILFIGWRRSTGWRRGPDSVHA